MSLPPPPGSFGSVPPNGGGGPSWGGQPQQPGQPYGAPHPGQPGGPWGSPQQWAGGPPPNKGGKGKWILVGLALVAVIAMSIVGTVLVLRSDSGGGGGSTPSAQNRKSEFASANDLGPVNIITEDPTCAAWSKIAVEYVDKTKAVKWADRDFEVPAAQWTQSQRDAYQTVGAAMARAADQADNLVKQTPHRVMRELYSQFIVYARLFVPKISTYTRDDDAMAVTTDSLVTGISNICSAISYGAAAPVAPLLPAPEPPSSPLSPPSGNDQVDRFLSTGNQVCGEWEELGNKFSKDTEAWRSLDLDVPATQWSPEQRSVNEAVAPVMTENADNMERLGRESGNPILEDFAVLAAQYRRGFVAAVPTYTSVDNFLSEAASLLYTSVTWACKAG